MSEEESEGVPTFTKRAGSEDEPGGGESDGIEEVQEKWDTEAESPEAEADSSQAMGDKLRDAFRSTEPHKPLSEIESPFDPENGGTSRVFRGIQKLSGVEGTEAWIDILIGLLEIYYDFLQESNSGNDNENESGDETEIVTV